MADYKQQAEIEALRKETSDATGEGAEIPSLASYLESRTSTTNPVTPYNLNDELTTWKNRIGLSKGMGLAAQRLTNPLMGFNHRMANNPVPVNREYGGVSFIVRPDLNLDYNNISQSRRFANMCAQDTASLDYSILAALDPLFPFGFAASDEPALGKPFRPEVPFDNLQAFIPLLSSSLVSFSGPPDNSVDSWLSNEGIEREQWGIVDSTWEVNYAYSGSTTFNNMVGNPIMKMMTVWLEYMAGVRKGKFKPRIINSIQRRIDYQSRIYTINYDSLGNIQRFTCGCIMWPTNNNAGAMASVDNTKPQLNDDVTITIQWQMIGARYDDPLYMDMFNRTVAIFNPDMIPDPNYDEFMPIGASFLRKLEVHELPLFNYYGYPHIDTIRRQLSWWVYQTDYEYVLKQAGLL
ncbi:hypothetical protein DTU56_09560 [Salmonella enterica subsp. enterica serovar Muenchen]|uniref:Virion structural protein n=1 Tax=Salmonella muenchen TaxID=596 RepID=A0A5U8XNH3_SALMU|nr:hypothetical protein [Salmonella enterica subsp. enterica serovar Muenchen]ECG3268911.1 hypothetical protein [Salmonella enterica subsp. enterica serovar Infantis]